MIGNRKHRDPLLFRILHEHFRVPACMPGRGDGVDMEID